MDDVTNHPPDAERTQRRVVAAIVGAAGLALIGYLALGMPGMDHGGGLGHTEHEAEPAP